MDAKEKSEQIETVTALSNAFLDVAREKGYKYNIIIFACVNLIRHIIWKVADKENHGDSKAAAIALITASFDEVEL